MIEIALAKRTVVFDEEEDDDCKSCATRLHGPRWTTLQWILAYRVVNLELALARLSFVTCQVSDVPSGGWATCICIMYVSNSIDTHALGHLIIPFS